ncbi:hypothetical protein EV363DRAFT_1368462 [Boletus edulis]|nr:hypothetical protein EV363DRAFT_1368462 [Boletus edulis]
MQDIEVKISYQDLEDVVSISDLAYRDAMSRCCLMDGECYIATEVSTQKIVGTALWFPPGKQLWDTDELRQASGFNVFYDKLDQATQDWWTMRRYCGQVAAFLKEQYGPETHQYQGNGIATFLLHKVLKKAATNEAIGLCTDSEKNVAFYKSLRFKEIGVLYMRHPVDGSDIKVWGFKQYGLGVRT